MARSNYLMFLFLVMVFAGVGCSDESVDALHAVRVSDVDEVEQVVFVSDYDGRPATSRRAVHRPTRRAHFETEASVVSNVPLHPPLPDFIADDRAINPANHRLNTPAHDLLRQARANHVTKLEVIANNLANANTTAFKALRVAFEDRAYAQQVVSAAMDSVGNSTPLGVSVGDGARVQSTQADFSQGRLRQTQRPLDVAIEGSGFFAVVEPNTGLIVFTRAGNFSLNSNGQIVVGSSATGRCLTPPITLPPDAMAVVICSNGVVQYQPPGSTSPNHAGQIQLANFINPEGLSRLGENLYQATDASGPAQDGTPGQNGLGTLRQGSLETSNVDVHRETTDWSQTVATLQAIDAMLR